MIPVGLVVNAQQYILTDLLFCKGVFEMQLGPQSITLDWEESYTQWQKFLWEEDMLKSPHENKINVSTCQPPTMIWWQQTTDYLDFRILISKTMEEPISAAQNYPFVVMDYNIHRKLIIC